MGQLSLPSLAAVAVALAACGGSSSTTVKRPGGGSAPSRLYTVELNGKAEGPKGAPAGRGVAVIAFHGQSRICWRFAHLHGFSHPTAAAVHTGRAGHVGAVVVPLSHGTRLHHQGCVSISPALTKAIWASPAGYYVNIHSGAYPNGAVRGQL